MMILFDIASYVTEKTSSTNIDITNYVSTDSLLQNKQGREKAQNLPPSVCNVTKFTIGDILVSNIRPYLKKIWQADISGACSMDVLVFRAKGNHDSNYLYAVLLQDSFFDYVMKATKGSKMPRGDQDHIMRFPIKSLLEPEEKNIGILAVNIEQKLQINNKISRELEILAKELYNYWFVQFDFPNENGRPYKASGGKMVYNEHLKREIPEGWSIMPIGTLFESNRGISYNSETIQGNGVPMINLASFNTDGSYKPQGIKVYSGEYSEDKIIEPYNLVMCNTQQTAIDFAKDIIGKAFLVPDIFEGDIVTSHHVTSIKAKSAYLKFYLHRLFNTNHFHQYIAGFTNGTNILGLIFDGVENYLAEIPNDELLMNYAILALDIEKKKSLIIKENHELVIMRDRLLPLLMNGQVVLSNIENAMDNTVPFNKKDTQDQKFEFWLQNQGVAARGNVDLQTLREMFNAMDEDD